MKAVAAVLAALVAVGVLFYVYTAPADGAPAEMTDAQLVQVEQAVKEASDAIWTAWVAEDIDAAISHQSGWAGGPFNQAATLEDLRRDQEAFADRWDLKLKGDPQWEVWVLGPDAALVKGTIEATWTDTTGVSREVEWQDGYLWVLDMDQWKMIVAKSHYRRTDM